MEIHLLDSSTPLEEHCKPCTDVGHAVHVKELLLSMPTFCPSDFHQRCRRNVVLRIFYPGYIVVVFLPFFFFFSVFKNVYLLLIKVFF